ncbi:MAG TPA: hypothetical protein VG993_09235 [Actinomycetota bacterium]|jgi:hypothetical protein|nr:hypothetical protein [Actinomycetota bacterium]
MRKKLLRGLLFVPVALVLSGCLFVMQGFVVLDASLRPGQKTIARFTVRPLTDDPDLRVWQFVIVGVNNSSDLTVGKAVWGTNGKFGGPKKMPVSPDLPTAMQTANTCNQPGFTFSNVTGITWKAFLLRVRSKGKVNQTARIDVTVKVPQGAERDVINQVLGVTGVWVDDPSNGIVGQVDDEDVFTCSGLGTSSLRVT